MNNNASFSIVLGVIFLIVITSCNSGKNSTENQQSQKSTKTEQPSIETPNINTLEIKTNENTPSKSIKQPK